MGTRNLTCVVLDGEYKVAQYGQWDGYPEGQGTTILDFLSNKMDREKFEAQLRKTEWIEEEEHRQLWRDVGGTGEGGFVTFDISNRFKELNPQLDRDMGGEILEFVQEADGVVKLDNRVEFALDSLFCEWAYVADLDNNMLEVYSGFNTPPVEQDARFQGGDSDNEYSPVALVKTFPLDDLPSEEEFLNAFKRSEEQREELAASTEALLTTLRNRDSDAETANHVANYIEANMEDFLEAIYPDE